MSLAALVPGVLALLLAQAGPSGLEVPSPSGRFVARIEKVPGQEALADALARWRLSMQDLQGSDQPADGALPGGTPEGIKLWSMPYPHLLAPARYFTSDDGSTFVRLTEAFNDSRPVLRMDRSALHTVELHGRDFALERKDVTRTNAGATWLDEEGDSVEWGWAATEHGPSLLLKLASVHGWRREVDISVGVVLTEQGSGEPTVFPGFPDGSLPAEVLEIPYVTSVHMPSVALGAQPLRIEVSGQHPTPNWKFLAFRLERKDEQRFVLTPFSRPPPAGGLQAQVLDGFRVVAAVEGLRPGRYELAVIGAGQQATGFQPVEILPGRTLVRLETSGGIAGIRNLTEVFSPGVVRLARSHASQPATPRHLTPDEQDLLEGLVASLPKDPRSARTTAGADFLQHRLGWWKDDRWREVTVDDGTAKAAVKNMIEFLARL